MIMQRRSVLVDCYLGRVCRRMRFSCSADSRKVLKVADARRRPGSHHGGAVAQRFVLKVAHP
jgi:hypothetical protein